MAIQRRLLLERIELFKEPRAGQWVMHGVMPSIVEEFRKQVAETTYADYCPELMEQREDVLPTIVAKWLRTSGHTSEYDVKWWFALQEFLNEYEKVATGVFLLLLCVIGGVTSPTVDSSQSTTGPILGSGAKFCYEKIE